MKILVFASLLPTATANYLISALRDLGHDLFVCSDVASPLANLQMGGAINAAQICATHGLVPDFLLFVEGGTMRILPVGLEHISCITAWYGIDTHTDYAKHLRLGRLFDVTFIAQKEFVERLQRDGLRQVHWLPLAFAPALHPDQPLERRFDIAYVGSSSASIHPIRHAMLAALKRDFPSNHFGLATPTQMGQIYASAKLVFNRSVNNDVNMRFFEAAGAGAVLLPNPIIENGVEAIFDELLHYAVYRDEASLLSVARDLLADPAKCEAMGIAARQRVLEQHTYGHRATALLAEVPRSVKFNKPEPEAFFSALLALDMLGAALKAAAQALTVTSGGRYRRLVGSAAGVILYGFGRFLNLLERLRKQ